MSPEPLGLYYLLTWWEPVVGERSRVSLDSGVVGEMARPRKLRGPARDLSSPGRCGFSSGVRGSVPPRRIERTVRSGDPSVYVAESSSAPG